jgi:hypothetical protein
MKLAAISFQILDNKSTGICSKLIYCATCFKDLQENVNQQNTPYETPMSLTAWETSIGIVCVEIK